MKQIPFFILLFFFVSCGGVSAQEFDIPLFAGEDAPALTEEKNTQKPNIGTEARQVDSLKIAPAVEVPVGMSNSNSEVSTPFTQPMKRQGLRPLPKKEDKTIKLPLSSASEREIDIVPIQEEAKSEEAEVSSENSSKKDEVSTKQKGEIKKQNQSLSKASSSSPIIVPQQQSSMAQMMPTVLSSGPDISKFNIAGVKLYMEPQDVIDTAQENGFVLANMSYAIPAFMTANFENECRADGLYQTRLIHECVRDRAKQEEVYYVSELTFENKDSKEELTVLFGSPLTGNKAFKVDYTGFGDNSLGTSYKDIIKKANRRDIFWKLVFEKYGKPNYDKMILWGDPRKAYLRAFMDRNELNARLVLEDKEAPLEDLNQAADIEEKREKTHNFSFIAD